MNQEPDRNKLRQEYLQKRKTAYRRSAVFVVGAITWLVMVIDKYYTRNRPDHTNLIWIVDSLMMSVVYLLYPLVLWKFASQARTAARLAYVPPITADLLPAAEILVRGSEEPVAVQSEVLLRAGQWGQETPKEELLRMTTEK